MIPLWKAGTSWITLLLFVCINIAGSLAAEPRVVCYYTNWSIYRPGTAKFSPQNINPYLCTHLIYAFGGFTKDNTLKPFDKYQDIEKGGYAKFTGLKTYNKNLKCMLAIGGWNEGSSRFSSLVASSERRQQFTKNTVKFLRQNHFDGLDLDWEYPAHRDGGKPRDRDNYAQFVQELREEFERESSKTGRPRLILTMAVPAGTEYIKKGYDVKKLNKYLDWFNLLSYDYHSAFEPSVNHHSPIYSLDEDNEYNYDAELNIDYSVKYYLNEGADRDKLVLGIPTYGRSYTLLNEEATEIGSPSDGPGAQGDATREKGYLAYYEICENIKEDDEWTVVQPNSNAMGPYAFKADQWVGYDDEEIARKKGEYVVANGLGGIMFWAIDTDDFRGGCTGKPYPIIEAAKEAMLDGMGLGANDVVSAGQSAGRKKPPRQRSRIGSGSSSNNRLASSQQQKTKDVDYSNEDLSTIKKTNSGTRQQQTNRRITSTTTPNSVSRVSRTTTPSPPTTPDPGGDFKCEDEGFYPHPRDCKKYFWCLDSGPSNLGVVAHPFSCPSGLVFNKQTDSCDYTRNVVCKTTTEAATTEATTTTSSSSKPRISITTTTRKPTTTTTLKTVNTDYDDEEDDIDISPYKEVLDEEDPKVIKELIDLIKKAGGIEQLEKQFGSNFKASEQTPTNQPIISKSLYEKVLNSASGRSFLPKNRYSFLTNRNTTRVGGNSAEKTSTGDNSDVGVNKNTNTKSDGANRYSSVIRNQRPGPQNEGLDKLPELDGLIKERPQYVTINRQSSQNKNNKNDNNNAGEEEDDDDDEFSENDDEPVAPPRSRLSSTTSSSSPQYVNIQRRRPTTTNSPAQIPDLADIDEIGESDHDGESIKPKQYNTLERRQNPVQRIDNIDNGEPQRSSIEANRFKVNERTQSDVTSTTSDAGGSAVPNVDIELKTTVPQKNVPITVNNNQDTTIRAYANIARRTTEITQTETPTTTTKTATTTATTTTTVTPTDFSTTIELTTINVDDSDIDDQSDLTTALPNDNSQLNPITEPAPISIVQLLSQNKNQLQNNDKSSNDNNNPLVNIQSTNKDNKDQTFNAIPTTTTTTQPPSSIDNKQSQLQRQNNNDDDKKSVLLELSSVPPELLTADVSSPRPFGFSSKRTQRPFVRYTPPTTNSNSLSSTSAANTAAADNGGNLSAISSANGVVVGGGIINGGSNNNNNNPNKVSSFFKNRQVGINQIRAGSVTTVNSAPNTNLNNNNNNNLKIKSTDVNGQAPHDINSDLDNSDPQSPYFVPSNISQNTRNTFSVRPSRIRTTTSSEFSSAPQIDTISQQRRRPINQINSDSDDSGVSNNDQSSYTEGPPSTTRLLPRRRFRPRFEDDYLEQNRGIETTTKFIERPLRPGIGSDLSSLTAADFYKNQEASNRKFSRRIWPNRTTSTTPPASVSDFDPVDLENRSPPVSEIKTRQQPLLLQRKPFRTANKPSIIGRLNESAEKQVISNSGEQSSSNEDQTFNGPKVGIRTPFTRRKLFPQKLTTTSDYIRASTLRSTTLTTESDLFTTNDDSEIASTNMRYYDVQFSENTLNNDDRRTKSFDRKINYKNLQSANLLDNDDKDVTPPGLPLSDSPIIFLNSRRTTSKKPITTSTITTSEKPTVNPTDSEHKTDIVNDASDLESVSIKGTTGEYDDFARGNVNNVSNEQTKIDESAKSSEEVTVANNMNLEDGSDELEATTINLIEKDVAVDSGDKDQNINETEEPDFTTVHDNLLDDQPELSIKNQFKQTDDNDNQDTIKPINRYNVLQRTTPTTTTVGTNENILNDSSSTLKPSPRLRRPTFRTPLEEINYNLESTTTSNTPLTNRRRRPLFRTSTQSIIENNDNDNNDDGDEPQTPNFSKPKYQVRDRKPFTRPSSTTTDSTDNESQEQPIVSQRPKYTTRERKPFTRPSSAPATESHDNFGENDDEQPITVRSFQRPKYVTRERRPFSRPSSTTASANNNDDDGLDDNDNVGEDKIIPIVQKPSYQTRQRRPFSPSSSTTESSSDLSGENENFNENNGLTNLQRSRYPTRERRPLSFTSSTTEAIDLSESQEDEVDGENPDLELTTIVNSLDLSSSTTNDTSSESSEEDLEEDHENDNEATTISNILRSKYPNRERRPLITEPTADNLHDDDVDADEDETTTILNNLDNENPVEVISSSSTSTTTTTTTTTTTAATITSSTASSTITADLENITEIDQISSRQPSIIITTTPTVSDNSNNTNINRRRKIIRRRRPTALTNSSTEFPIVSSSDTSSESPLPGTTPTTTTTERSRKLIRKLIRKNRPTLQEDEKPQTSPADNNQQQQNDLDNTTTNIELLPVRGYFRVAYSSSSIEDESVDKEKIKSSNIGRQKLTSIQEHINYSSSEELAEDNVEDNSSSSNDESNDHDEDNHNNSEDDVTDESEEIINIDGTVSSSTTPKSIIRNFGIRPAYRPVRPTAADDSSPSSLPVVSTPRSYVRKNNSHLFVPSSANQANVEDENNNNGEEESPVRQFGSGNRFGGSINRFKNVFKDDGSKKEDEEINEYDGDNLSDEDYDNDNDNANLDISNENTDQQLHHNFIPSRRPSNRPAHFNRVNIDDDQQPLSVPVIKPSILLNRQRQQFVPSSAAKKDSTDDETDEIQRPKLTATSSSSYKPKSPRLRPTLPSTTPSSRKQNIPYNSKPFPSSGTLLTPSLDRQPTIEDLDRNALNSRNKKIFEKNSKKHLVLTQQHQQQQQQQQSINNNNNNNNNDESQTDNTNDTNDSESTSTDDYTNTIMTTNSDNLNNIYSNNKNKNDEYSNTFSLEHLLDDTNSDNSNTINFNELQETTNYDTTSQRIMTNKQQHQQQQTTTQKPTTLHHIFAIDYDDTKTEMMPLMKDDERSAELITQKLEKLAEVNRIVEISSQLNVGNNHNKSTLSNLIIEQLPTIDKLGEISRITLIKVVDNNNNEQDDQQKRQGSSTMLSEKTARQLVLPAEKIFSVETSTIPLEALFDKERTAKKLQDDKNNNGGIVYATSLGETENPTRNTATATTVSSINDDLINIPTQSPPAVSVNRQLPPPLLRPDTNESSPLVISIANLDQVVLSRVSSKGNDADALAASSLSSSFSTGKTKVPSLYRPNIRRPGIKIQKNRANINNDINDISTTTVATTIPAYRKRSRPTTTTAPPSITNSAAGNAVPSSSSPRTTQIRKKIFDRSRVPSSGSSSINNEKQTRYFSTTPTSQPQSDITRTPNPLFRRRTSYTTTPTRRPTTTKSHSLVALSTQATTTLNLTKSPTTVETIDRSSNVDQNIESSFLDSKFTSVRFSQIGELLLDDSIVEAITHISKAPLPIQKTQPSKYSKLSYDKNYDYDYDTRSLPPSRTESVTTKQIGGWRNNVATKKSQEKINDNFYQQQLKQHARFSISTNVPSSPTTESTHYFSSSIAPPTSPSSSPSPSSNKRIIHSSVARQKPSPLPPPQIYSKLHRTQRLDTSVLVDTAKISNKRHFSQISTPSPINRPLTVDDYDYYDDGNAKVVKNTNSKLKVILHDEGLIECLDQGNFPHPLSCRKFISCAKMEIGGVVGWAYTCPKGLSYDPVGGICNWSAGLGCKEN